MAAEITFMKRKGCAIPKVKCDLCCEGKKTGGTYNRATNELQICALNMFTAPGVISVSDNGVDITILDQVMYATMKHEFIHAFDACILSTPPFGKQPFRLGDNICDEVRAHSGSGECDDNGIYRRPP